MPFHFSIKPVTPKQAFALLSGNIRKLDWFMANGRKNRMDFFEQLAKKNPLIQEMVKNRSLSESDFEKNYFTDFKLKLYQKSYYQPYLEKIQKTMPIINKCYDSFCALKQSWGFEVMARYDILLDLFGIGGRYFRFNQKTGWVIIGAGHHDFLNLNDLTMAHTIVHEMVHLGIEDLFINPQHLKQPPIYQEEKERIVDSLCAFVFQKAGDFSYQWKNGEKSVFQERTQKYAYMDQVVGKQPEENLPRRIQQFLKEKEREQLFGLD